MHIRHRMNSLDRRLFLSGSAAVLAGLPGQAKAQTMQPKESLKLSVRIADFVAGFELKHAPPLALERTRTAFVDTVGVTLAGSTEKVAEIVREMVRAEGAAPAYR